MTVSIISLAWFVSIAAGRPGRALASDPGRAEELIREANDLRRQGKNPAALPLLREAYRIARSPRTAAQLGLAELSLGYWLEAERHLAEAVAPASHPWVDQNRKVLQASLDNASAHIGSLSIEGRPPGAEVHINDAVAGTLPLSAPVKVAEGEVSIEVSAPGHKPATRTIQIAGRTSQMLSFDLQAISAAPAGLVGRGPVASVPAPGPATVTAATAGPGETTRSTWRLALPWALAGSAAVGAGLAIWQHVAWQTDVGRFDDIRGCGFDHANAGSDPRCQGLHDQYMRERTRAFIGYGVAGLLGLSAAIVFFVDVRDRETPVALVVGNGRIELGYRGRF
jgi:hypothetical protein